MKSRLISPHILFNNAYCFLNPHTNLSYVDKRRCVEENFRHFNYPLPKFYLNDIYSYEHAMFDSICELNIGIINILNYAKKTDMPYVVSLEDDICMHKNMDNLLQLYLDAIPDNADVVQLGYCNFKFDINTYCKLFYKLQPNEGFAGSQFLIIFKRAYDKLLHLLVEDKLSIDYGIGHLENTYASNIPLCIQYDIKWNDPRNNFFDIAWGLANRINYVTKNDNDKSYIMQNYLFNHSDIYKNFPLDDNFIFKV